MTSYDQYVNIATFVKSTFTSAPVFIRGEVIKIDPPYIVLRSFGIINEHCGFTGVVRKDVKGYNIFVYEKNIGRTEKLLSEVLNDFTAVVTPQGLDLENLSYEGGINRLEDDLYEGVITFRVTSIFSATKALRYATADSTLISSDSTAYTADAIKI